MTEFTNHFCYLAQLPQHLGTKIFKLGREAQSRENLVERWSRAIQILFFVETEDRYASEKLLLAAFEASFFQLGPGLFYGSLQEAAALFNEVISLATDPSELLPANNFPDELETEALPQLIEYAKRVPEEREDSLAALNKVAAELVASDLRAQRNDPFLQLFCAAMTLNLTRSEKKALRTELLTKLEQLNLKPFTLTQPSSANAERSERTAASSFQAQSWLKKGLIFSAAEVAAAEISLKFNKQKAVAAVLTRREGSKNKKYLLYKSEFEALQPIFFKEKLFFVQRYSEELVNERSNLKALKKALEAPSEKEVYEFLYNHYKTFSLREAKQKLFPQNYRWIFLA